MCVTEHVVCCVVCQWCCDLVALSCLDELSWRVVCVCVERAVVVCLV